MNKVISLDLTFRPEAAVSAPMLFQTDDRLLLSFNAVEQSQPTRDLGRAVIKFPSPLVTRFGYPNDEAQPAHPLYRRGFLPYDGFEVLDSSWKAELERQNRIAFPRWSGWEWARHFVFTFHDSMFECLAESYSVRSVGGDAKDLLADALRR